jgi:RsmE family RNA methyltransferase
MLVGSATRVMAHPGTTARMDDVVAGGGHDRVVLAVGPEGGWNEFETALLEGHGFLAVGMGPRTLRTDTACIALLALVHSALAY